MPPPPLEGASPHGVVEFLTAVTRCEDSPSAYRTAAELVAEELDAEVGAVLSAGVVDAAVGFGRDPVPAAALESVTLGIGTVVLDGLGPCHTLAATLEAGSRRRLVVARIGRPFAVEDRNLLLGMARALGISLDLIGVLERERAQHRVVEVLLGIQRSISHRAPLEEILAAVTDGATTVLEGRPVSLILDDALDPGRPIVAGADLSGEARTVSAPVHINGVPAGALLVATREEGPGQEENLLAAFAEHASLALTDARTVETMQEAFRDPLTGLPNRRLFLDRLTHALAQRGTGSLVAVLFVDLDRFKAVNDSLGHAAGDELLRTVAARIERCVRAEDTAARFGGDEFAVVLHAQDTRATALVVADRIIAALREPFSVDGRDVFIGVTIGIAYSGVGAVAMDADVLLGNADLALYEAKADGGGRARAYDPMLRAALVERLALETEIKLAHSREELEVHYQPVVDLGTAATVGFEALLRWRHPERGLLLPAVFIPVAETTGHIVDIGRWVLREACVQVAEWRRQAPATRVYVNVSVRQLREGTFVADVEGALRRAGVPGAALTLEITESVLVEDHDATLEQLRAVRALGVSVALDDFGTGYSSLSYLQRFPVDLVKIDRSFVSVSEAGDEAGVGDLRLTRAIVELGRSLELGTVAEGVETQEQWLQLRDMGCRWGQGHRFGEPVEAPLCDPSAVYAPDGLASPGTR